MVALATTGVRASVAEAAARTTPATAVKAAMAPMGPEVAAAARRPTATNLVPEATVATATFQSQPSKRSIKHGRTRLPDPHRG